MWGLGLLVLELLTARPLFDLRDTVRARPRRLSAPWRSPQ
jgi:hypothetical protein